MERDQLPVSTAQLIGHATSTIVGGLTPAMLGVLLLNLAGISAAIYFLNILITGQQNHLASLLNVQRSQIELVMRTHDREFDALMLMIKEDATRRADDVRDFPTPLQRP